MFHPNRKGSLKACYKSKVKELRRGRTVVALSYRLPLGQVSVLSEGYTQQIEMSGSWSNIGAAGTIKAWWHIYG